MPNTSTNFTPFFMMCSLEAMLPTKLQFMSPRVQAYQPVEAEQARQDAIDFLEESRGIIVARSAKYQKMLR
jgi:hypothetical protein